MSESPSRPNSKVARVIEKYDLGGMGDQLEVAWTGEHGERTSFRNLADKFNRAVLEAAIRRSDGAISETDLQSAYQTLADDNVSIVESGSLCNDTHRRSASSVGSGWSGGRCE